MEDFITPEVGLAVLVTSIVSNTRVQTLARRGLVLGMAGGLAVVDGIKGWASGFNGRSVLEQHHAAREEARGETVSSPSTDDAPEGVPVTSHKGHSGARKSHTGYQVT